MNHQITLSLEVFEQVKNALGLAAAMLDKENQPPQFTREEAFETIKTAHETLLVPVAPLEMVSV